MPTLRIGQVISSLRSLVGWFSSSTRRVWWTSFVLVTCLSGLWALANPLFAAPDEPTHVIRAVALDHGQLTGSDASPQLIRRLNANFTPVGGYTAVRVPAIYGSVAGTPCFAFQEDVTAACLRFDGSTRPTEVATSAGNNPPAYFAAVGVASWLHRPGSGPVYLMRLIGALVMGAFIATAITALRRTAMPRLVAIGLLVALTPMVLFLSGAVNPSGPEIAASIALWVCGLVLLSQARERIDNRLVTAVGIAGCVLALARQLGPLWIALIALAILGTSSRVAIRTLARSHWARMWGGLIVACCLAQVVWNRSFGSLEFARPAGVPSDIPTSRILRVTAGATFGRYREMIGAFGWLDTPSPALTYVIWTALVGLLFVLALTYATRRRLVTLLAVLVATIVVPIALDSAVYGTVGAFVWQGRYTLPIAMGIPIFSAMALASTERGHQVGRPRLFLSVGAMLVVAQALAFAQNLRRYTVGYNGEVQFWRHPQWSPPLSPLLLTIAFAVTVTAFVAWVLGAASSPEDNARSPATVMAVESGCRPPHEAAPGDA